MKRWRHIFLIISFLGFHQMAFSTHIVGGTLTYKYIGGNNYVVTLKLYRDCGKITNAPYTPSITISVLGNNGASLGLDFDMALGPVTPVPSGLPACSTPPNPLPCVEEGIYTKTVNFPPIAGGYHLYFQLIARNYSLTNINSNSVNQIGTSYYAYIPGNTPVWSEDFSLANGTTVDNGSSAWSIAAGAPAPASASVSSGVFEVSGANNALETWTSQVINIASKTTGVNISADLIETGNLEAKDSINVYYRLNGGALTLISALADDFNNVTVSNSAPIIGNTIQIIIKVHFDPSSNSSFLSSEVYGFDNIQVSDNNILTNSNPTFTKFPPLFICKGESLSFDHSATDLDGDSLAYAFYTPYDGDNGAGTKDPTFTGNTPVFKPVVFLNGYSTTNPLGGAGLTISSTGLLTGTPPALGQYVVGIKVKEYRKGVLLSETLRDFQFNIVTCSANLLVGVISAQPVICFGSTSTTISANPSGGTPPYKYLWNNTNSSQSISVGVGTYTVKLTDAVNCAPVFATATVTSYTVPVSSSGGTDQSVCYQHPTVTLQGAVFGPSTGVWSGGAGKYSPDSTALNATYTPTAAEITAGHVDLTLTTTGSSSCPTGTDVVRITYKPFLGTLSVVPTNVSCYGLDNGSIAVSNPGGSSPYTYFWTNAKTTATISSLAPSTYSVTITDAIGCTKDTSATITEPTQLAFSATATNVTCPGASTGSVVTAASGGTSPYSYLWKPGSQTTSSITNQLAGTYTVVVTDSKGCTLQKNRTITEPTALTLTLTSTDVSCFGGSDGTINSAVSGGTGSYSYSWTNAASSPNLTGLAAGTYSLTVTDDNNCTITKSVVITEPSSFTASTSSTNITCNGLTNGTATAIPAGGTAGYTYLWQPGSKTTATISNRAAGTYTVIVTDANGCPANAFATITEPTLLSAGFVSQTDVSCFSGNDGSVTANASGGTPNYTYAWTPGGATTTTISNKTAGTYSVTITDSKGCTAKNAATITEPAQFTLSTSKTNETCSYSDNGTATAIPTGGTAGYTYIWLPGALTTVTITGLSSGTYSITSTDSKGCSATATAIVNQPVVLSLSFSGQTNVSCFGGSNGAATANPAGGTPVYSYSWLPGGATTAAVNNLAAGSYTVTVTDSRGCTASNTIVITEPTAFSVSSSATDETCDYSNNGTATATPSGGTAGYTYLWQPGAKVTGSISNLTAGTYSVTVTDSKGCTALTTATVAQPTALAISFTPQTNVSCFAGNDGAVATIISGGTPNYSYLWSPGNATTNSISNLAAGTYSLTITDSKSCTLKNSVAITQPVLALSITPSATPVSCFGGTDGTTSSVVSGGTAPYSFVWQPGSLTSQNISGLTFGTYSVTVTDSKGCTKNNSVAVNQSAQIILTTSSVNSDCGQPNGQASVSVSGGNIPYSYLWSPSGKTSATATGLLAGSYSVTVTDATGCSSSKLEDVSENTAPVLSILLVTDVSCNGGNDGAVTIGLTGGKAPFVYSWSPAAGNDSTATGLTAGVYTASVLDANGCKSSITTNPNVLEPTSINVTVSTTPVSCFAGSDGTATVSASGGTPGYTYKWLPGGTTGSSVSNLSATTYSVEVTDANNCKQIQSFVVSQPSAALAVAVSSLPTSCFGGSDGFVSGTASGGTALYNYNWMPGNYNGQNILNLSVGTYTVTVKDSKLCVTTNTVAVTQPTLISLSTGSPDSHCSLPNGQANVVATGGTGTYLYQWSPQGGTNATATGLLAGSYTVEVTDNNSCVSSTTVSVLDQPGPLASVIATSDVSCFGGNDGTATATFSNGTGPFTYSWAPSGGSNLTASGLTAGTYTVTVTDANGCQSQAVSPLITQPQMISVVVSKTMVTCFGFNTGAASVSASGGSPGYTYLWLPSGATGTSISNLTANTYTVQVTDAGNCVQPLAFTITEPAALAAIISPVKNVGCFQGNDGEATASVSGGTQVYSYQWLPIGGNGSLATGLSANTYTVNVTDFNGCATSATVSITQPAIPLSATGTDGATSCFGGADGTASVSAVGGTPNYSYIWSPYGGTGQSAVGLSAQSYFISITDSKGCQTNASVVVTEPTAVTASLVTQSPSCGLANGSISSQVSGGAGPYSYLWSFGAATASGINAVGPGSYTVQVMDSKNCPFSVSANLVNIPGATVSASNITPVSCFGGMDGAATINISLGSPPYSTTWLPNGATTVTNTLLTAGSYTANVTDSLGCVSTQVVTITEPTDINISISSLTDVLCFGDSSGAVTVIPSGGTPSYFYSWSPYGGTSATADSLSVGTYTVNVTDKKKCPKSISINITEPTQLLSSVPGPVNPLCYGLKGSAFVMVSGGTIPYGYSWSTTPVLTGSSETLSAGTYTITITDANGCISNNNFTLTEPTEVITTAGIDDTICSGQVATLTATAAGGAGNHYYAWQPTGVINGGTLNITPTTDTTYIVVAYDKKGCPGTADTVKAYTYHLAVGDIDALAISPICPGRSSVISVNAAATTGPVTYQWDNNLGTGPGDFVVTPSQPTTYNVIATSTVCGTSVTDSVNVAFNPLPAIVLASDTNSLCVPGPIQFLDSSITGNLSDPITSWLWNFGDGTTSTLQNPRHVFTQDGSHFVSLTVNTLGGCTNNNATSPFLIEGHLYPKAAFAINSPVLDLPVEKLSVTNQSIGASIYDWNFGDGGKSTAFSPEYNYSSVGVFQIQLIASSKYECSDTAYATVRTDAEFVFPNVFTPNTNGPNGGGYDKTGLTNDVFFPYTSGVIKYKLEIFNRWGELIFESTDIEIGWDGYYRGQICQQDVYIWKAFIKLNNGKEQTKSGDVTLLR